MDYIRKAKLAICMSLLLPACVADADIIFWSCFFLLSFFFFSSPNLSGRRWDACHICTHSVALVRIWDAGLKRAEGGSLKNTGRKKSPKIRHLGAITQICRAISSQLRHVSTIGKKFVKQQYLPHMFLQYDELRPTNS